MLNCLAVLSQTSRLRLFSVICDLTGLKTTYNESNLEQLFKDYCHATNKPLSSDTIHNLIDAYYVTMPSGFAEQVSAHLSGIYGKDFLFDDVKEMVNGFEGKKIHIIVLGGTQ